MTFTSSFGSIALRPVNRCSTVDRTCSDPTGVQQRDESRTPMCRVSIALPARRAQASAGRNRNDDIAPSVSLQLVRY